MKEDAVTVDLGEYYEDPLDFLTAVMNKTDLDLEMRMAAAKILAQVKAPPRRKVHEYKGKDAVLMEQVDSDSIFLTAGIAAPKAGSKK